MIPAKRLAEILEDHHEAHLMRAEVAELVTAYEALQKIRRIPSMPFPDPGAHSWAAFAQRVHGAWCDIQRIASEALFPEPTK